MNIIFLHALTSISINIKKKINTNINYANVALFFNTKYEKLAVDRTTINKIWKNKIQTN